MAILASFFVIFLYVTFFSFGDQSFRAAGVYYVVIFRKKTPSAYKWVIVIKLA